MCFFVLPREVHSGAAFQDSKSLNEILLRSSRGCGFGLRREQNFRTMCGSRSHPVQPQVVLCFCNFKCCSLVHCRIVHVHVLFQISSRSPHRHLVESSSIFRSFLIIPTFLATLLLLLLLLVKNYSTLGALESIDLIKYYTLIIYNIDTFIFNGFGRSILELMSCQKVKSYELFKYE
jgi:hypothetical protein